MFQYHPAHARPLRRTFIDRSPYVPTRPSPNWTFHAGSTGHPWFPLRLSTYQRRRPQPANRSKRKATVICTLRARPQIFHPHKPSRPCSRDHPSDRPSARSRNLNSNSSPTRSNRAFPAVRPAFTAITPRPRDRVRKTFDAISLGKRRQVGLPLRGQGGHHRHQPKRPCRQSRRSPLPHLSSRALTFLGQGCRRLCARDLCPRPC